MVGAPVVPVRSGVCSKTTPSKSDRPSNVEPASVTSSAKVLSENFTGPWNVLRRQRIGPPKCTPLNQARRWNTASSQRNRQLSRPVPKALPVK